MRVIVSYNTRDRDVARRIVDGLGVQLGGFDGYFAPRSNVGGAYVYAVAFSPDGKRIATGSADGFSRVIEVATGREISRVPHGGYVYAVAFRPNGKHIATESQGGTTRLLDAKTGAELARNTQSNPAFVLAFTRDGTRLAVDGIGSSFVHSSIILNAATAKEIDKIAVGFGIIALALSPKGTHFATGCVDGAAQILIAKTWAEIAQMEYSDAVTAIELSPDSTTIAAQIGDGTVRIVDAATGDELARIELPDVALDAAFSPDRTRLATMSREGTIRLFYGDPNLVFEKLCAERLGRNLTRDDSRRYIGNIEEWRPTCPDWENPEWEARS